MLEPINDNCYPVGMFVYARVNPTQQLQISKYYQRIYYCRIPGNPEAKYVAYFERELLPPEGNIVKTT